LHLKAVDNEFSGNMIDVCPVGALTDKTFRFKSRVWFNKPYDAQRL
jgi:NADH-quinone oxidoreductase subunit G